MSSLASFGEIVDAAARVRSAKMELAQCTSRLQSATARLENAYAVLRRATRRHFEECAVCGALAPFVDDGTETPRYRPDGDTAWSEGERAVVGEEDRVGVRDGSRSGCVVAERDCSRNGRDEAQGQRDTQPEA
ncbi:TPA_asm: HP [Welwitschia mirabilis associated geminivirus B]|nr:TPA_asm: HP [Welwitschia mirabilis associated geminivirus B]